jgi:hypothetical protein
VRVAFWLALAVSLAVHGALVPLDVPHGFQMNDVEGEVGIPIDVFTADDQPSKPPAAEPNAPAEDPGREADKPPPAERSELAPHRDAGARDAATDASPGSPTDAASQLGADAAIALAGDDGGGAGRRDPEAILGADSVRADVVLVYLVINAEVIRAHPVGARMGYLLRGIPQWDEFMSGTDIDPIRDADWVAISGPSLINTARDMVLVHYSAPDAVVDRAVRVVSSKYTHGGPIDAGVRGVRAVLMHADRAERVLLRPQPHLLAVVPPSVAERFARYLVSVRPAEHPHRGEAVYLRLVDPHHPMPEVPDSITEMRLRVVARPDEGADVFIDGDTKDADTAAQAADGVRRLIRRHNDTLTALVTHGLLDHVEVTSERSTVKVQLTATRDQIETLVAIVGGYLGVQPPAPSMPGAAAPPAAPLPGVPPGAPVTGAGSGPRGAPTGAQSR